MRDCERVLLFVSVIIVCVCVRVCICVCLSTCISDFKGRNSGQYVGTLLPVKRSKGRSKGP